MNRQMPPHGMERGEIEARRAGNVLLLNKKAGG